MQWSERYFKKLQEFQVWKMSKCSCPSVEMSDSKAESAIVGLESVDTFCYLGDMLSAGGGVEEAEFAVG